LLLRLLLLSATQGAQTSAQQGTGSHHRRAEEKDRPTTVIATTTRIRGSIFLLEPQLELNLDPDDLPDHEISNRLQRNSGDQQRVSNRIRKQRPNECWD
jgi:hypothetical protein